MFLNRNMLLLSPFEIPKFVKKSRSSKRWLKKYASKDIIIIISALRKITKYCTKSAKYCHIRLSHLAFAEFVLNAYVTGVDGLFSRQINPWHLTNE